MWLVKNMYNEEVISPDMFRGTNCSWGSSDRHSYMSPCSMEHKRRASTEIDREEVQ